MNRISKNAILVIGFLFFSILTLFTSSAATSSNSSVQVQLLSPKPNSNIEIDDIMIVFSILKDMEKVELAGITLFLDNIDASPSVQLTDGIISFLPLDIKLGAHKVTLKITDKQGKKVPPISFSFNIIPSTVKQKALRTTPIVRFTGQNSMTYQNNDTTGPGAGLRQEPSTSNYLNIGAAGEYKGIKYEAKASISSESSFNMQPTDSYSLKVYTGWGGIIAGDSYPSYSSLVMSGSRVRGAAAYGELKTEKLKLRLDGVVGQSKKYTPSNYTPERDITAVNATLNMNNELQLSAVYLNSEDKSGEGYLTGANYYENKVLGLSFSYAPSYNFSFKANYATSDTTDIQKNEAVKTNASEEAFIGNTGALDASLMANLGSFYSLSATFAATGLDYKSFGNPYQSTDYQQLNVSNSFYLFNRGLTLTARYSNQRDNLSENLATTTTTASYYGYLQLSLGTNFPTLSGSYTLTDAKSEDTTVAGYPTDQETNYWTVSMNQNLSIGNYYVTAGANYSDNRRKNQLNPSGSINTTTYGGSLSITLPNSGSLSGLYSKNETTYPFTSSSTVTESMSFSVDYPIIASINVSGSVDFTDMVDNLSTLDQKKDGWQVGLAWKINNFQKLTASYGQIKYKDNLYPTTNNYDSDTFSLTYVIYFDGFSY